MENQTSNMDHMRKIADDAQVLLDATANMVGDNVSDARRRLTEALDKGKQMWNEAQENALQGVRATDQVIRDNPYKSIAIALCVGAITSCLLFRRK